MGTFSFSTPTLRPWPYQNPQHPLIHMGTVAVTGSLTVDLGIRHNNFIVMLKLNSAAAADTAANLQLAWEYAQTISPTTGVPGQFTITCKTPQIATWSSGITVTSNTTGALASAGYVTAVDLTTGTVTGAGNLRSTAPVTTRDVQVSYSAAGVPTINTLAADAVTQVKVQQSILAADATARQISFIAILGAALQ